MAVEYLYWGVAAWTGALVGRGEEIKREWKFETRAKLEAGDLKLTAIIKVIFLFLNSQTNLLSSLTRTPQPTSCPTFLLTGSTTGLLPALPESITVNRIKIFLTVMITLLYCGFSDHVSFPHTKYC